MSGQDSLHKAWDKTVNTVCTNRLKGIKLNVSSNKLKQEGMETSWRQRMPLDGRRCYCCVGWWYVPIGCQYKPFRCNPQSKFWLGVVSPQFEGRGGHRSWRWVLWVTRWWLPICSPSNHRPINHPFHGAPTCHGQMDGQTDGTGLAKCGIMVSVSSYRSRVQSPYIC